jgi:hypothetical protein
MTRLGGHLRRGGHRKRAGENDALPCATTEKGVDRRVQRLAGDVVKCHFDGGSRRPRALERRIHLLQTAIDCQRVFAGERAPECTLHERTLHPARTVPERRNFAVPFDPLIGPDDDNAVFVGGEPAKCTVEAPRWDGDRNRLDVGDPQA